MRLFPKRFTIARMSRIPLVGRVIDWALFKDDRLLFIPKTVELDVRLGEPESMVLPYRVAEHFVNASEYLWVMNFCICRASNGCKDYPHELGCLFLGEATQRIDPRLGRRVTREEALEHLRRCREVGLVHLVGRNKLDSLWLDVRPGEKLLTICSCCPCCCLWKVIPDLSPMIRQKITKMPGVEVSVDRLKCAGCGGCTRGICFVDAISLKHGKAEISDECRGCGRCAEVCPLGAISISISDKKYMDDAIRRISSCVDL
ncbi:MAG: 4Fe-4S binding protein [Candidatus Verstraetearchaeota archaeon]|nr:4Fe-4S binding protein [Candidatus Verstraetearchaeota archaeon]